MTRRWVCASNSATTSSLGRTSQSNQGESAFSRSGRSGVPNTRSRQIIWTKVVPDLERVLTTMSPGRKEKSPHRALSSSAEV